MKIIVVDQIKSI